MPGAAGDGVDSGLNSFGMGMGSGAGFDSIFGGEACICAFQPPSCQILRILGSVVILGSSGCTRKSG